MKKITLAFLVLMFAQVAQSGAYKCTDGDRVSYQEAMGPGCVEMGISVQDDSERVIQAQTRAAESSRQYHEGMREWEQRYIAKGWADVAAKEAKTRQANIETDLIRAETLRIQSEPIVHPQPQWGTPFFPMPVYIVNKSRQYERN